MSRFPLDSYLHSATPPYHPRQFPSAIQTIKAALETIGIYRTVLIRSSWSEGLHLYIPLPAAVSTFGLACALKQCLEAQGLAVSQGKLEIFPNCKTYAKPGTFIEYNAHRLPLQPASGSCLLDDDYHPISQDLGRFFEVWDIAAAGQDLGELRSAIATARTNRKGKTRRTNIVEDWQQDLLSEMQEGWTAPGQTNPLLKTIACYGVVFEELQGDALAAYIERTASGSPGYAQWCRHQHEITQRAQVWARAAEGYYWPLGDLPKRTSKFDQEPEPNIVSFNGVRSEEAQQRIRAAVNHLETQGTLPAMATARANEIANQGGISLKTLYRHRQLWHPLHYQPLSRDAQPELSKIPSPEAVSTIITLDLEDAPKTPEPSYGKEFYTLEKYMKGERPEPGFLCQIDIHSDSGSPRRPVDQKCHSEKVINPVQSLLLEYSENETVTEDGFPQPLQSLWDAGTNRQDIEDLLRLRSDWNFQCSNDAGVQDGRQT